MNKTICDLCGRELDIDEEYFRGELEILTKNRVKSFKFWELYKIPRYSKELKDICKGCIEKIIKGAFAKEIVDEQNSR
ncbi:MAG: hypothetical protein WC208_14135 [Gallionella sp.]|jgi:hypothetical protein